MAGMDAWSAADTHAMLRLAFDGACIIVAWLAAERCRMWSLRCKARDKTIARLRAADANRRAAARALPAAPKRAVPAPRTRFQCIWPGTNPRPLPVAYGLHPEPLVDPCLVGPPDPVSLAEWLAEPQAQSWPPLTTGELLVEQALTAFEARSTPTERMWVVPNMPDGVPHLQEVTQ